MRRSSSFQRVLLTTLAFFASGPLIAGSVHLRWDPVTGAAGYRVYYGTSTHQYGGSQNAGSTVVFEVDGLSDCREHFLAVKAYNSAGDSPSYSNEVRGWPRPEVDSQVLPGLIQGARMTLSITGKNFQPGAELVIDTSRLPLSASGEPLVRITSASVISCHEIEALVEVEPTARGFRAMEIGEFALGFEVFNPDSVYGSGPVELVVELDPERLDVNRSDDATRDRVDGKDLVWLAYAHGAVEGDHRFNADADLNGDGLVDGEDLAYLAVGFGLCWNGTGWSREACR